jgi:hypothetical protein
MEPLPGLRPLHSSFNFCPRKIAVNDCERLIRDFCALTGLSDPESIARGSPLDVAGITCSITLSRHDEANALVLYCEFGAVPAGRENAICEELLVQNFVGAPEGGVTFGFSPVAKNVICVQHLRASDITAQRLVDILNHLAEKAVEWRRTYFLKSTEDRGQRETVGVSSSARAVLGAARSSGVIKGGR